MGRFDHRYLYAKLPVWAQRAAVSAYGVYWNRLRFGSDYKRYVQDYQSRDRYAADAVRLDELPLLEKPPLRADARAFVRERKC